MSDDWNSFSSPVAPSSPAPAPAASAATGGDDLTSFSTLAQRSSNPTYQPLERFIKSKFPNAVFTSDYRDPAHNKSVGGVEGSYHKTRQAVDMTGLSDADREQLKSDLHEAGVTPREFLFHNAGSGLHLHVAADELPDSFLQQWGDHPAPQASTPPPPAPAASRGSLPDDSSPDRQAEIAQAQKEATALLVSGDEKGAIAHLAQHRLTISPEELEAFHKGQRTAGFRFKGSPSQPGGTQHDLDYYGDQIRRGIGDVMDAPANVADLVYKGGQAVGRVLSGGPVIGAVSDLPLPPWSRPGQALNADQDQAEKKEIGYVPEAANDAQRYAGAAVRLGTGAVVPAAKLAQLGKARAALSVLTGGATGGITGEAAHDAAPLLGVDPDKARFFGQVIGSAAGSTPLAAKPIAEARFVNKQVANNPSVPFDGEFSQDLRAAKQNLYVPTDPRGRAALSVKAVNSVTDGYLDGIKREIKPLVSPARNNELNTALEQRDHIGKTELDALRTDVPGNAVADAITAYQRGGRDGLTPELPPRNRIGKALQLAGDASALASWNPLPAAAGRIAKALLTKGGDAEAARVNSADAVIKRGPLYDKILEQTGPSGRRESRAALTQAFNDHLDAIDAASTQAVADKATAAQARTAAATQAAKDVADAKAARSNMTPAQHAAYQVREASAAQALQSDPVPGPQPKNIASSLKKVQAATSGGVQKLSQFDDALAAPAPVKPVKISAEDLAIKNNMAQGLQGYHRAYADSISSHLGVDVTPQDVLSALKKTDLSDVDPFQVEKFQMQHKVSQAAKAAILPRVEAVLKADKSVMERPADAAPAAKPAPVKAAAAVVSDTANPAAPKAQAKAPAASSASEAAPDEMNYKSIRRPVPHAQGRATNEANFDRVINDHAMRHDGPIMSEAASGIDYIRNTAKTTEDAMGYFDDILGPKLHNKGFDPAEIDNLRETLKEASTVGKTYRTQAQLEHGAMTRGPGRPRSKPGSPADDVPF
jgi:hypothetical protein